MGILLNSQTRVIVQGFTGREGTYHSERMIEYGTKIVGGVTPGKGGAEHLGRPVFDTVKEACDAVDAQASVIFVPAPFCKQAIMESISAGLSLIVCITEGIPIQDMVDVVKEAKDKGVCLIGPNCPGLMTPGEAKMGIIPASIALPGCVGLVSRSGTLTYEIMEGLTQNGIGQSTCVGIGGDPVLGYSFSDVLREFEQDMQTEIVVQLGEIGGTDEENSASVIQHMTKPVVCFISGKTAPEGKRMGHAGAIVSGSQGTAESKESVLKEAGVHVVNSVDEVIQFVVDWYRSSKKGE